MTICLQLGTDDNVANVLEAVAKNDNVSITGWSPGIVIVANETIRCYHKIALSDIAAGADVVRDGYIIGRTKEAITRGDWVHIHNLESKRA
jgi:hypothetical protein